MQAVGFWRAVVKLSGSGSSPSWKCLTPLNSWLIQKWTKRWSVGGVETSQMKPELAVFGTSTWASFEVAAWWKPPIWFPFERDFGLNNNESVLLLLSSTSCFCIKRHPPPSLPVFVSMNCKCECERRCGWGSETISMFTPCQSCSLLRWQTKQEWCLLLLSSSSINSI